MRTRASHRKTASFSVCAWKPSNGTLLFFLHLQRKEGGRVEKVGEADLPSLRSFPAIARLLRRKREGETAPLLKEGLWEFPRQEKKPGWF